MDRSLALRIYALVVLTMVSAGCELAGDIFQAGMWVGIIVVVGIIALVMFAVGKLKS